MGDFQAQTIFDSMGAVLSTPEGKKVVDMVKAVFVYRITKGGKTLVYTSDLKNGSGAVYQGEPKQGKADVELTVSDDDFIKLLNKQANAQQLFMGGKLKLKGNLALAMKFEQVFKALSEQKNAPAPAAAAKPAAAPAAAKPAAGGFGAQAVFDQMTQALKADPSVVEKMKAVFVYRLTKGGQTLVYTADLKNGKGAVYQGEPKAPAKADVEFSMSDDDFVALVNKKANPQQLFMGGKMKLKGNMALAMKFEQVLKSMPQPTSKL